MLKILDAKTIDSLLSVPELAAGIGAAFTSGGGAAPAFARTSVPVGDGELLLMPAAHATTLSVKLLTLFDASPQLPAVQGLVPLFDAVTGRPLAVLDATAVTRLRTAAVSALATDLLAPRDARVLTVIGAGVQGRGHLEGLAGLRPWSSVRLHSRDPRTARGLAEWARGQGIDAEVHEDITTAVRDADVICTATSASRPLFEDSALPREGLHVNAVGAYGPTRRELPTELVTRARLFVESEEAVLREAGDVLIPVSEGALPERPVMTELGDVLSGRRPGRRSETEVTVFESVGVPVEDAVACDVLYQCAVARGAGVDVGFD
ncbi:ornithine cyclodeaminase family protein [Streptomyces sp. NPDC020379]|uniref:ornithine cyclodeaminase family protein n=1 Tax=Streptomyces sp. NPDC020379 TaxID=3365071 RepID=UPI0037971EE7